MINSDFMPMAFKIYGTCSEKFEEFLKKMVKAASEGNHVPFSMLLHYWRKRFFSTLQTFNTRLVTQAYLVILIMMEEISSLILVLLELLKCCLMPCYNILCVHIYHS